MDEKLEAKAAFAVNTGIVENSGSSSDVLVVDLNRKADRSSSANATLRLSVFWER